MDFSLNEVQEMLDDTVEKFIGNDYDFETRQKYAGSDQGFSSEVWQMFAELGWTAVPFSEEDGGFGGGPIDLMVLMLRFGKGLIVEPYLANIVLAGGVLRRAASAAQKERWLQPIIAGELQAALAFVEPQSRYDVSSVATAAQANGTRVVTILQRGCSVARAPPPSTAARRSTMWPTPPGSSSRRASSPTARTPNWPGVFSGAAGVVCTNPRPWPPTEGDSSPKAAGGVTTRSTDFPCGTGSCSGSTAPTLVGIWAAFRGGCSAMWPSSVPVVRSNEARCRHSVTCGDSAGMRRPADAGSWIAGHNLPDGCGAGSVNGVGPGRF